MNNKTEELELNGKWVKIAQNCRFEEEPGAVTKREPIAFFNTTPTVGDGGVLGLYRFYSANNIKTLMAHDDKIYVGDDTAGTFTEIRTLSTAGNRVRWVTYQDIAIGFSKQETPFVYDGSSDNVTWELGACKAVTGGAGSITATDISYKITYDADAYIPDTVSNEIASVTAEDIELSNIPASPAGSGTKSIYRKNGGAFSTGGAWKFVATIAFDADVYTDSTNDITAGATISGATDTMPKGDIPIIIRERLFFAGDPDEPNRIYFSSPFLPHYIQHVTNLDFLDVAKDDGDEITGLVVQLGILQVFKRNTIRKVYVASAQSGADPNTWFADDPISFVGSPAKDSIVQTPFGIIFLGWDRWYKYDGNQVTQFIDEFNTRKILPANYNDVIAHYTQGVLYAAYTDGEGGSQINDRIMVYNFTRDRWSVDTLNVAAFSSHEGDDESGELFYGSAEEGTVYKAEETDQVFRLSEKTQAEAGTQDNVFVGGTDTSPSIEIGSTTTALELPVDICILWDSPTSEPGSGWDEITSTFNNKFIQFGTYTGSAVAGSGHTHSLSGSLAQNTNPDVQKGDNTDGTASQGRHTHSASGTSASDTPVPRHTLLRIFKYNGSTGETEFPIGSIVMWDQASQPTGFTPVTSAIGYYVRIGTPTLPFEEIASNHSHSFSFESSRYDGNTAMWNGNNVAPSQHTHTVAGTTSSTNMDNWELDYVGFRFLKKTGESDTWDGVSDYVYTMFASAAALTNGWSAVTTYNGSFLKLASGAVETGSAANASHTHTVDPFSVSGANSADDPDGGPGATTSTNSLNHSHAVTLTAGSGSAGDPEHIVMVLARKILGQMKDYNSAITSAETEGMWESPSANINAQTLKVIEWNSSEPGSSLVEVFFRHGPTMASVEDTTALTSVDNATDTFTLASHGLTDGDRVRISATVLPTGINGNLMYYVVGSTASTFQLELTSGGGAVDFTTDGTAVAFKKWTEQTDGNTITTDPSVSGLTWIQYLFAFTSTDTSDPDERPRVFSSDSYILRFFYERVGLLAETSVDFVYDTGFINFDKPFEDKIFNKINIWHSGDGSYTFSWTTEHSSGSMNVDMDVAPTVNRWDSYFQDDAFGRRLSARVQKNDLFALTVKEISGLYIPEPNIV
jgi:hypothetical protein